MHLLFTRFPLESSFGGAEVQTLALMRGLKERGHEIIFLGSCPTLLRHCRTMNIEVKELAIGAPPVTKWHVASFLWRKATMQRKLEEHVRHFPEAKNILMLSLSEKILLTPFALNRKMNVFWIEHDRIGPWLTKNPWCSALRALSAQVTTVCVSELSRKLYLDLGWESAHTIAIPNGIDPLRFGGASPQRRNIHGPLRIGCVARLTEDKGVDLLIEAMSEEPRAMLTIVGEGREKSALEALITSRQLEQRVRIEENTRDLGTFYRSLDLLVLPSREHDPFGLVAAEAMMLGIPVIVTDACGIAGELSNGEDGVIVKAGSTKALSDGIAALKNNARRASIAETGERTAREKFSIDRMVDRYEGLF